MATPLTADKLVAALRAEGLTVDGYKSSTAWRTHNRNSVGAWGGVNGVIIHHTAGSNSLGTVYNGRPGLPGPLAHSYLGKDGKVIMVGHGRANHAGLCAVDAFNAVVNESATHPKPSASSGTLDGNAHFYGIEIENLGNGRDVYPAKQYDAAVRWAAAICRAHGWTANSVVGHLETSVEGKVDPRGPVEGHGNFDMNQFRRDVAARLAVKPAAPAKPKPAAPKPKPVVDLSNVVAAARRDPGLKQGGTTHPADVKLVEAALKAEKLLGATYASDGSFGSTTVKAFAAWQRKCGFKGSDADGIPGRESLTKLGAKHGFTVKV